VDAQRTTPFEPGPDIYAEFNPARTDLYFGTDGRTPSAYVDFESVVLHEIGHGLGLVGAGYVNGTRGYDRLYDAAGSAGPMTVFDTFTYAASPTATKPITSYVNDSSALGTALEGFPNSSGVATGGVYWSGTAGRVGGGGAPVRLYAPGAFQDGSSYSHLDEGTYLRGNPNALMTPALSSGEAVHDPGPIALGMLSDMGWAVPGMPGSAFVPVSPVRLLDTRAGLGAPRARVGPGGTVDLKVAGTSCSRQVEPTSGSTPLRGQASPRRGCPFRTSASAVSGPTSRRSPSAPAAGSACATARAASTCWPTWRATTPPWRPLPATTLWPRRASWTPGVG